MLAISEIGDKDWRLIDPRTNQVLHRFTGHSEPITGIAFSADGRRAVTSSDDGTLRLWDVQTGQTIDTHAVSGQGVIGIAISPDGEAVVTVDGGQDVRLWEIGVKTGQAGYRNRRNTTSVAFAPNGSDVIFGYDKAEKEQEEILVVRPLAKGRVGHGFRGPSATVTCIAASPDGRFIAAGLDGDTHVVSLWETASRRMVQQFPVSVGSIHQVAFSSDSRFLLASAANHCDVWSVGTATNGEMKKTAENSDPSKDSVLGTFSPDSTGVTFVYRKGDEVALGSTIPLPSRAAVASVPSTVGQQKVVWNPPIDPDRDCKFQCADGKLTITVPGKDHDLGAERGRMNAPRLLCDVEGDFTAQVRVSGDFQPSTDATVNGKVPVVGAGLVLFLDERTYVRLERFGLYRDQRFENFVSFELRRDARMTSSRSSPPLTGSQTFIRLERRGDTMLGFVSEDGQKWDTLQPLIVPLPRKIKLGVDAITTSSRPFASSFDQFQLRWSQGDMVRVDWPPLPSATVVVTNVPPPRRLRRVSNKPAVPNEQTLNDKRKLLQAMYRDDYKNKTKRALAAQLLQEVRRQGDRALSYAMLNEACDLASHDGDLDTSLRAASELERRFVFEPLEVKSRVLEQTLSALPAKSKEKFRLVTQKALLFLDRAVIQEDFDVAEKLLEIARTAAAKADASTILLKTVNQEAKQLKAILEEYDSVKRQAEKLDSDPDDSDANLALGRFRCFIRNNWDAGLPLLTKGSDKALSELAEKDLVDPPSPAARAALGDAWWDRAEKLLGKQQDGCRRRAFFWYLECIDDLDGKAQSRVSSRLKKLSSQLSNTTNPDPELELGGATPIRKSGTLLLRLSPWQNIDTRQLYHGPIDIRVTALLPKNHIRISFLNGGEVSLNSKDMRTAEVRYSGHFADDPDRDGGSGAPTFRSTPLLPNSLQVIRILATGTNCTVWINGKQVISQGRSPAFTAFAASPVRIWSDESEVDVKSLVVKRVR